MIARLIELCMRHRTLVVFASLALALAGGFAATRMDVDAIPDLSDVQVILRTEYPGQAPRLVEDQVTYPLTTGMLAVPGAESVRGYSMFGTSFVYIIFEDGTDMGNARSRVLEQLASVRSKLPPEAQTEIGPFATAVGWVFQYALVTGPYCADHPDGLWHDPVTDAWYPTASPDALRADPDALNRLEHHRIFPDATVCPLSGQPLAQPELDLADLQSLQRFQLAPELTAVEGVAEVATIGGHTRQYQIVVDPVRLLAYDLPISQVVAAIKAANVDQGGRVLALSETEYMVRSHGLLGAEEAGDVRPPTPAPLPLRERLGEGEGSNRPQANATQTDADESLPSSAHDQHNGSSDQSPLTQPLPSEGERGRSALASRATATRVLDQLRETAVAVTPDGVPIRLADVAQVRIGPDIRRGILEWNGTGETAGGIVVMRYSDNALATIANVKTRLTELETSLPAGVTTRVGYDRSDLIERSLETLQHTLLKEMAMVALVMLLFLVHARSALVAAVTIPAGICISLGAMALLGIDLNIMSLGGIAIAIGVMVDSAIVLVENAHKHLEDAEAASAARGEDHLPPADRQRALAAAAKEVGPSLFLSLLIITVSFLPVFLLAGESGRLFRPLAATKTFAMAAAALLAVTLIPALLGPLIRHRVLPDTWRRWHRILATLMLIAVPIAIVLLMPSHWLGAWAEYQTLFAWGLGAAFAIVVLPQRIMAESRNPLNRLLERIYTPVFVVTLRLWPLTLAIAIAGIASAGWAWQQLGSSFMPPLEEGDILYMPTTTEPGLSIDKARELLQQTDKLLMQFPEVDTVLGKIGRAETATDPAPLNMIETTITLHRDKSQWRQVRVPRFYSDWPSWLDWAAAPFRAAWPDQRPITTDELIYGYELAGTTDPVTGNPMRVAGMNEALSLPGLANAWTMPIRTRIDMLATGIRTPVGIKVLGPDLATLANLTDDIASTLRTDPRTSAHTSSATADRSVGGKYLDIRLHRDRIARYGLTVADVQNTIATAIGGRNVSQTIEGLERYPINVRYPRDLREFPDQLANVLVATPRRPNANASADSASAGHVPLGQLATFELTSGPPMIKSENARPTSWVYVEPRDIAVGDYIAAARNVLDERIDLPPGYTIVWSGTYERMREARERLTLAIPLALALIVGLLYLATGSWLRVLLVFATLSTSVVGAIWLVYLLDYDLSLAIVVGLIALLGLDAETSLIILLYLDNAYDKAVERGQMQNADHLWAAVYAGAVQRIRPKTMTVVTSIAGLLPLMFATGAGADTMRHLAAPMIGGLTTSFLSELIIYPVVYYLARRTQMATVGVASPTAETTSA